jgi:hypothetical protein
MAFDITKKRVSETGIIELKGPDGAPLLDDEGNLLSVTVCGPGSKVWQQANADMNRKKAERLRKNGNRIEAAFENIEADKVDFLVRVTVGFNGWVYPVEKGGTAADMYRAAYSDDAIGYIREHVFTEATDWSAFTNGSATN